MLTVVYLVMVEFTKVFFYARVAVPSIPVRRRTPNHRISRRAAPFSVAEPRNNRNRGAG
ncbi:MAG: hypothetical protein H7311_07240 [Ramlibacter sp.]|nr:hypothetical protein [Cryobacterium sp.]